MLCTVFCLPSVERLRNLCSFLIDSKRKILLHTTHVPNSDLIGTCGLDNDLVLEIGACLPGKHHLGHLLMQLF